MTTTAYPNFLASGVTAEGTWLPFELFAGESDIVTGQGTAGATPIVQFQVIARDTDGTLIPWAGTGTALGIAAQPIAAGVTGPYFIGGYFNHEALVWPGGVTTLAARKAAFDGTTIQVGAILGSSGAMTFS